MFAIMLLLGLVGLATGSENAIYSWVFTNVYTSLSSTLYAITGFYIFSAAYRAFRARNFDAVILLIGGCLRDTHERPNQRGPLEGIPNN